MGREARKGYLGVYAPPFGGGVRGRGQLLGPVAGVSGWGQLIGLFVLLFLKLHRYPTIYLSSSKVVWHGILLSGDVCHPIIRVDVIDTKEVQTVQTEPDILKDCVAMAVVIV